MKKNFKTIFASMLAVLSCVSCSQNDDIVSDQDLTPKSLVISLPKTATSRSVESPLVETAAPKYTNITTIYYDGGDNGIVSPWSAEEITALKQTILKVVKPASVQVIVNIPTDQVAALTAAKTKTAVDAVLAQIAVKDQNLEPDGTITSAQQTTYSGLSTAVITEGEGTASAVNKVEVEISSITSRFEIGTLKVKPGSGLKSLTIEKVFFNNYLSVNSDLPANVINVAQDAWAGANPTAAWAMITGSSTVTSAAGTKAYAFQTFPVNVIPQIIFRVSGELNPGSQLADGTGSDGNLGFSGKFVTIKGFNISGTPLAALAPHKIYQVAMDAPLDISEEDITGEPNQAEVGLNVTIKVAPWTKQELTPEIQ